MTSFALIRHGPTEWNEQHRLQGQSDIPLSKKGKTTVGCWQVPTEYTTWKWYASPMTRAQQTAAILGLKPDPAPDIVEMHWGDWEGKTRAEIEEEFGDSFRTRSLQGIDMRPQGRVPSRGSGQSFEMDSKYCRPGKALRGCRAPRNHPRGSLTCDRLGDDWRPTLCNGLGQCSYFHLRQE